MIQTRSILVDVAITAIVLVSVSFASPIAYAQAEPDSAAQIHHRGPVTFSVSLDRFAARVAEPIVLQLRLDAPAGTAVQFPQAAKSLQKWNVIANSEAADLPIDDQRDVRRWEQRIELESLQTGSRTIPAITVAYRLDGSQSFTEILSKPIEVEITSVLDPTESPTIFRDIKGPTELPVASQRRSPIGMLLLVLSAVILLGIAALVIRRLRQRRTNPMSKLSLEEIAQIESAYQDDSIRIEEAYDHLSAVTREYLRVEWNVPANALSTQELVQSLRQRLRSDDDNATLGRLSEFLLQSDQIKFGGGSTIRSDLSPTPFEQARRIVKDLDAIASPPQESA